VSPALSGLTLAAALGCGLNAGVFFAFSSFVMPGLDRLPPEQGIASMQSLNVTAVRPVFMTVLFGTALLCVVLVVWGAVRLGERPSPWLVAGGAVFVLGTIVVTIAGNVPLNDALEALDPGAAGAAREWTAYVHDWTLWNHVRAVTGLLAAGAFTVALTL
jgi:uncharacterized membrane protein